MGAILGIVSAAQVNMRNISYVKWTSTHLFFLLLCFRLVGFMLHGHSMLNVLLGMPVMP